MSDHSSLFNEFTQKVVKTVGITTAVILLVVLMIKGFHVILLILAGVLVASFFLGIADFIKSKTPLSGNWSLGITVLLVLAITIGTGFALVPSISDQVASLKEQLPNAADKTFKEIENTQVGSFVAEKVRAMDLQPERSQITNFFGSIFGLFSTIYIIVFLGIFFTANPKVYLEGMVRLFPKSKRKRTKEILVTLGTTLQKWLWGKMLSMLIVGILSGVGLGILGVPLALTLAIFAALISFIPNFGPLIALIPAFLLGYTVDPSTGLYVVILYVVIQAVESNVLTPFIQKKMISFPMAMVLIGQVLLGVFTGILGVILAVPLLAVIMVLVKMAYVEDVLKDKDINVNG